MDNNWHNVNKYNVYGSTSSTTGTLSTCQNGLATGMHLHKSGTTYTNKHLCVMFLN